MEASSLEPCTFEAQIGYGYVMKRTGSYLLDPRDQALRTASNRSIGEPDPYREGTQLKNAR
jgi:hypothetical protein